MFDEQNFSSLIFKNRNFEMLGVARKSLVIIKILGEEKSWESQ